MECLNKVILMGNLVHDASEKTIRDDLTVQEMRLAVTNLNETLFIDVTTFNKSKITSYLTKGRGVIVEGRLKMEEWTSKDGKKQTKISVSGEKIVFLPSSKERDGESEKSEDNEEVFAEGHHA